MLEKLTTQYGRESVLQISSKETTKIILNLNSKALNKSPNKWSCQSVILIKIAKVISQRDKMINIKLEFKFLLRFKEKKSVGF